MKSPKWQLPFFVVWGGQAFSLLGSRLVQFALVWWLTKTTGSATVLALASMMAILPQVFVSPFAGALVDRWNRRIVMIVADSAIALTTLLLVVLYALDVVQVWHIYGLMLIRSIGGAFHWPAFQASTTLMVPEQHLARVGGLNQSLLGLANVISPPLGALLLELLPMEGVVAVDVGTALLAVVPLLFILIPQPVRRVAREMGSKVSMLIDLREGFSFLWGWAGMIMILVMAMLLNFLTSPAMSLLPLLVTKHFGGGALQLAWLQATFGVGVIIGGAVLGIWGGFRRRVLTALLALAVQGLGVTLVGLSPATALVLAIGAMSLVGLMHPIVNGSLLAIIQATVPPEMQGRVMSLVLSGATAMSPIGLAVAGPLADALGVRIWFLIAGVASVAMGWGALFIPSIMRVEERAAEEALDTPEGEAVAAGG